MTFQVGLYSGQDLAPSCRARGAHVCIRYPATRSGPESVAVRGPRQQVALVTTQSRSGSPVGVVTGAERD